MSPILPNSYAARGLRLPSRRTIAPPSPRRASLRPAGVSHGSRARSKFEEINPEAADTFSGVGWGQQFDALRWTDDRTPIPYFLRQLALRAAVSGFGRQMMAGLGAYLFDNFGRVFQAITQIADYTVPIIPQAASDDPEANKLYDAYFMEWAKRADFTGRFDYWWLQRLQVIAALCHGDIGRKMIGANGFPQVQLIECWRIGGVAVKTGLCDGVAFNQAGQVLGYYLDDSNDFVPASQMRLVYDPERYSRYRGLTPLRRGANDIRDVQDTKSFTKLAAKIRAALCAVIEGGPIEEDTLGNDTGPVTDSDPVGGNITQAGNLSGLGQQAAGTPQQQKFTLMELLGGDIPVLPHGQVIRPLTISSAGPDVMQWLNFLAGDMISGLGVPPSFLLDQGGSGPEQRTTNGKAQRRFDRWQDLMAVEVEWDWVRVIGHAIATGELPAPGGEAIDADALAAFQQGEGPRPPGLMTWTRMEWQGPAKISIDDGRDAASWREDFAQGLRSRQQIFGDRQQAWKREVDHQMAEDDYIIDLCLKRSQKTGVPLETLLARMGIVPPVGGPTPPTNEEPGSPPSAKPAAPQRK